MSSHTHIRRQCTLDDAATVVFHRGNGVFSVMLVLKCGKQSLHYYGCQFYPMILPLLKYKI